ncbi:MBL fold metallo-hydrolase [Candidatus Micrarchaeota archaeon]|nr:MBL fold metallo-hydrolase [Candidatus Micrarchaeota archaeon]MBU1930153.1 MBL fold metallo-hydrolase [Candidatus Micrarchaeota archaeon]
MPTLTILGSGSSYGVPAPGCTCLVCRQGFQPNSKQYRTRSSVLIENQGKNLLIDLSPDFREQALKNNISCVDACLITHGHADSIMGLQDLRSYSQEKEIPVFASPETIQGIQKMFYYMFDAKKNAHISRITLHEFSKPFSLHGLKIAPIEVIHPPLSTAGFRIQDLAHIPDIKTLSEKSKPLLEGIKTLIVGATGDESYYSHQSIFEAIALARELKAEKTFFTHIGHRIDHIKPALPSGMQLAFDGLKIEF